MTRSRGRLRQVLVAGLLLVVCARPSLTQARTIVVAQDGSGDVTSIQPAVTLAAEGDTIRIRPGIYTEHEPYIVPGYVFDTYVAVKKDNLTFIGDDRDTVIIGPPVAEFVGENEPKGFIGWDEGELQIDTLRIESLTVRNVANGTNWSGSGYVRNVRFLGCDTAVIFQAEQFVEVANVEIRNCRNGILVVPGSIEVKIASCTVVGSETGIDVAGTQDAQISKCMVESCAVGIQLEQFTKGMVVDCSVVNAESGAYNVTTGATGTLLRCFAGPGARITVNYPDPVSQVISRSFLGLGAEHTVLFPYILYQQESLRLNWSDLEVSHPKSIWFFDFGLKAAGPIPIADLTNNYWALPDSASIADVIWDHHDNPLINVIADFVPFQLESTPNRKSSFGGTKARFDR